MNLTRLFNINYLLQNLKKSKVVLSIFIGLIPILNTIILIMMLTSNKNYIPGLTDISIINLIGIYILPIIISICLFNYIYKKKSVDFIGSMPISRKSIYITNTIIGIIIFMIMLLINAILIYTTTAIFNIKVPFMMLLDYFWFFLIVYIFTFSATNLAMTVSGNAITQIVVTLLLFFLVPYTSYYITNLNNNSTNYNYLLECNEDSCLPEKYYCYENEYCIKNKEENKYSIYLNEQTENTYTMPFGLLYSAIDYENSLINTTSVIKMIILSIIYIILGYFLFLKRKMEVSETSFKNIHVHNIVKSLTLVPIVSIAYYILKEQELIFTIFVGLIILIYYFIYDLITKKSIQNIRLSLIYFVVSLLVLTSIFKIADLSATKNTVLKYTNITEISLDLKEYSGHSITNNIYTDNKDLISIITKELLNTDTDGYNYIPVYLKISNKEYKTTINIDNETFDNIINIISKEKDYINYYKNINTNGIFYTIKLGNRIYFNDEAKHYLELINKSLKNITLKEFFDLQKEYQYTNDEHSIEIYTYKNHNKHIQNISGYINYDLLNSIVNSDNLSLKDNITPVISNDFGIHYINSYLEESYTIDYYIVRSAKNDIYEFILRNIDNKVDMRKEYFTFKVMLNGYNYNFTTNKVEEIKEILNKKYQEIKDTKDYQNYTNPDTKESVQYYD